MALKLRNKRWYPFIFLGGAAIAIGLWVRFVPEHRPELLVSAVGAVGGFTYFFYRQHLDETKLLKELFVEFNQRYADLNQHLNSILFGPQDGLLSTTEREHVFSYFNLCAEEHFFYKAGYVDADVWQAWSDGMRVFFKHPRIRALWNQDCTSGSYYGFKPPV